jgi:hypothetical protein
LTITVPSVNEDDFKKQNRAIQALNINLTSAQSDIAAVTAIGKAMVGQIPGTTGTTQPAAGFIGERISASTSVSVATSGTSGNMGQITITPGVWDIEACWITSGPGATTTSDIVMDVSNVTAGGTIGVSPHYRLPSAADVSITFTLPRTRLAVSADTTLQQNLLPTFSGTSYGADGILQATRVS